MAKITQHIVPHQKGWAVRKGGSEKVTKTFQTKEEAKRYGREISIRQDAELFIHGKDGQIQERNSYGPDPYPPEG